MTERSKDWQIDTPRWYLWAYLRKWNEYVGIYFKSIQDPYRQALNICCYHAELWYITEIMNVTSGKRTDLPCILESFFPDISWVFCVFHTYRVVQGLEGVLHASRFSYSIRFVYWPMPLMNALTSRAVFARSRLLLLYLNNITSG